MRRLLFHAVLLALMHSPVLWAADYYDILGVDRSAEPSAIQRAYRRLAAKYHPDANRGNEKEAGEQFKEAAAAYEVLSDEAKRREYDRTGGWGKSTNYKSSPDLPEGAEHWPGRGWYYKESGGEDVFFDPKTGFPLDFKYNPKTKSDASDLFDELLNPRNLGKRKELEEQALALTWTVAQKKDFLARAREVLRAATTHEMFPSNENYRRMYAVFDLPFILNFPELAPEFLGSHPRYHAMFRDEYLVQAKWMDSTQFPDLLKQVGGGLDGGHLPLSIVGVASFRAGRPTGAYAKFPNTDYVYEVHEVLEERLMNHQAFKRWAPFLVDQIKPESVARLAEELSWFEGEAFQKILPEIELFLNSKAFKQAEKKAKPGDLTTRMLKQLRDKFGRLAAGENVPRLTGPECAPKMGKLKKRKKK